MRSFIVYLYSANSIVMKILLLFTLFLVTFCGSSQTPPQGINYQAVAHDASGDPLANQSIVVRIGILSTSSTGTLEWEETHNVTTNDYGLFDLVIGMGSNTGSGAQATFATISWGSAIHFLKVEIDPGTGYETIGTMQFMSVPYAMHAATVANDAVDDADADATNELITGGTLNGTDLEITDAGGTTTVDLSSISGSDNWGTDVVNSDATLSGDGTAGTPLTVVGDLTDDQNLTYVSASQSLSIDNGNTVTLNVDDADANATNELITGGTLNGTDLEITDAGGTTTVDLSSLSTGDDWGTDVVNSDATLSGDGTAGTPLTVVGDLTDDQNLTYVSASQSLSIDNGNTVTLNVDDADANATNELITGGTLNGTDLEITDAGGTTTVDLSSLASDADWTTATGVVHNATDVIGIGTTTPNSLYKLTIDQSSGNGITLTNGSTGAASRYGIRNQLAGNMTGNRFATYNHIFNGTLGNWYGQWNEMTGSAGSVNTLTGSYNNMSGGDGRKIGVYNNINGGGSNLLEGIANYINSTGGNTVVGVTNNVSASVGAAATVYGTRTTVTGGTGAKYGLSSAITSSGTEFTYGLYSQTNGTNPNNFGVYVDGESRNYFSANVGIGTNNPSNLLDVEGTAQFDAVEVEGAYTLPTTDGSNGQVLTTNGTGAVSWSNSGDADWDTGTGVVYNMTDMVGIGISIPNALLDVHGSENVTNIFPFNSSPRTTIAVHNAEQTNGTYTSLSFSSTASNGGFYNSGKIISINNNHTAGSMDASMIFMTREASNITEAMRITGDNHIGIGTTNPTATLDLVGTFQYEDGTQGTGRVLTSDANGNATWKPNQVAFHVGSGENNNNSNLQSLSPSVVVTLDFDASAALPHHLNPGGVYNTATDHFVAPVSGVYFLSTSLSIAGAGSNYVTLNMRHSAGTSIDSQEGFINTIHSNRITRTLTSTVHLNAGDEVWIEYYNTTGGGSFYRENSTFSGHLVYAD